MRNSADPNRRVQDGLKLHWLCSVCEERFGRDERTFANEIFYPCLEDPTRPRAYGPWLLRFCTSVSWRVLRLGLDKGEFHEGWQPSDVEVCREAERVWREFLMEKRPHPAQFRQHMLPLVLVSSASPGAAPNINRYLTRAIQMDLCHGGSTIFTLAKLGRFIVFGMVRFHKSEWQGTAIQANQGTVGGAMKYVLPRSLWGYFNDKARHMGEVWAKVSEKQREKIDQTLRSNLDSYAGSDAFRAMQADVEMFGQAAFQR